MKFTAQEEYGLRCLVAIARKEGITIPEIARFEGLTEAHVAKLLMILRKGGFLVSARGQTGGTSLSRPATQISVREVVDVLGGRLYDEGFCERHSGRGEVCTHSGSCSLQGLWTDVQSAVDHVLDRVSLAELARGEDERLSLTAVPAGVRGRLG